MLGGDRRTIDGISPSTDQFGGIVQNAWRTSGTIQGSEGAKFVAVAIGSTASIIVGGPMGSSAGMVWSAH